MNNMTKIISTILLLSFNLGLFAQNLQIKGKVVDNETMEPLIGVHVKCVDNYATTDIDGDFTITVNRDDEYIHFLYIGYKNDSIKASSLQDVGIIKLTTDIKIMPDVIITSQLAVNRKTPIATSNISSETIEERLGNNEFVEALKYTPGVHANKQGGGWGDSEIFMRGFDNTNIAILVNGIPVNDMETGKEESEPIKSALHPLEGLSTLSQRALMPREEEACPILQEMTDIKKRRST